MDPDIEEGSIPPSLVAFEFQSFPDNQVFEDKIFLPNTARGEKIVRARAESWRKRNLGMSRLEPASPPSGTRPSMKRR